MWKLINFMGNFCLHTQSVFSFLIEMIFIYKKKHDNEVDLGFPEPIGVTRINCLTLRLPLHAILRTLIVLPS